ncbi:BatA and WFA domain-containing protein [Algibacter aquimarinus]|uniref:BatA and WFA domain-containing protein n=1 Tax=Algibacter aquimarinus TaxID=1136748 RepID=A0ABP9HHX5_9FLAO
MQFKNPELLYALFLLLIPIIIHLFQLRKFQKIPFTNVAFLKEATLQTRKSSQIKKWLILLTRLLLISALVFAFAQPFVSKTKAFKTKKETVIYLDNSFSMQAKGNQGELLKRAIQDIITNIPEDENISLITNSSVFKNTTIKAIKNELLQLPYSANSLTTDAALLKTKTFFSDQNGIVKDLIFISDFQENESDFSIYNDSLLNHYFVKLKPVNTNNISLESVAISNKTATNIELKVTIKNNGNPIENLPVSLFNNNNLIAKTSVSGNKKMSTTFSIPTNDIINGKITIDDANLQFDNILYFNINSTSKVNVLSVNATEDSFLKRIYTNEEFNYISTTENQLNYNLIESQNLIILNELDNISSTLLAALKQFTQQNGTLIIIPSKDSNKASYNQFLLNYQSSFDNLVPVEKRITTINYSHPLYNNGVFEKQVKNFQYPKVNSYFSTNSNTSSSILSFEDGKPFLFQNKNTFIFTASLKRDNSSFKNSPLIVPTLYNIGKYSYKVPELYYTIGKNNTYDVNTKLQQDNILSLNYNDINIIPEQRYYNNKVAIKTSELPSIANTYSINNKTETIKKVSYNYDRNESNLNYKNLSNLSNIVVDDSIQDVFETIKSDTKVNALWKWFVIFALTLLIIEMLILKYFK